MTDRDRRISLQQQLGHRTSDDLAASNNTGIRAADLDLIIVEQLNHSSGGAWHEHRPSHCKPACIHRMETVDVFHRIDGLDDLRLVNPGRQRKLSKNTVD